MKRVYVFTQDPKEKIDEMLADQDELMSETDGDVLVIFAESMFDALWKMKNVQQGEGIKYYSVIDPEGIIHGVKQD